MNVVAVQLLTQDCSMPGFPVLHYFLELAQIQVHWVSDAIWPSYPLSSPFPFVFNLSIRVFANKSALHIRWPKDWSFSFSISPSNEYSGLNSFRIDWFDHLVVPGTKSSPAPQFKCINSLALSILYGPSLTSVHDCWKNHGSDYMAFVRKIMSLLFNTVSRLNTRQ